MEIKDETLNKIMQVLSSLPYNQIAGLMNEIHQEIQYNQIMKQKQKPTMEDVKISKSNGENDDKEQ